MRINDILMDNAENETYSNANEYNKNYDIDKKMNWWHECKFGLFIHWGLYSLLAGRYNGTPVKSAYAEHIQLSGKIPVKEYEKTAEHFNPVKFNAREWVSLAKEAGMRHIIITAKHHDGFAMYDSKVSRYNIVEKTPYGKDPIKELFEEARRQGLIPGFYYSHSMDWHHPDSQGNILDYPGNIGAWDTIESWIDDDDKRTRYERYIKELALPQVDELLTDYGKIGAVWFDCGHKLPEYMAQWFIDLIQERQPECIVNRRICENGWGDYMNYSDNQVAVRNTPYYWESIATVNNSWGYRADDMNYKSLEEIIRLYIGVIGRGGHFLLNIGPKGDGSIDENTAELLRGIGEWMCVNSESVYETEANPMSRQSWGECTVKGNKLYLHIFDYPADLLLIAGGIRNNITGAYMLADKVKTPLKVRRINDIDVEITLPADKYDGVCNVAVLEFDGEFAGGGAFLLPENKAGRFNAFDCEVHGKGIGFGSGKKNNDTIKKWESEQAYISWVFRVNSACRRNLAIEYSVEPEQGGDIIIDIAGEQIQSSVRSTNGFEIIALKDVFIPEGTHEIKLSACNTTGDSFMAFRNIYLS